MDCEVPAGEIPSLEERLFAAGTKYATACRSINFWICGKNRRYKGIVAVPAITSKKHKRRREQE